MKDKENEGLMLNLETYKGDEPYVFVSYAHKDKNYVYPEIFRLHALGFRIWYDMGIEPGKEFWKEIAEAIKKCSIFVVFLSPDAATSSNVAREVSFAITHGVKLLAIHLKKTELSPELQIQIGRFQAILKYKLTEEVYLQKVLDTLPQEILENETSYIDKGEKKIKYLEDTLESISLVGGQKNYKYQVFINFRNLDLDNDPTYDSILAQKMFRFLSGKGLKVFHNIKSIEHMDAKEAEGAIVNALESSQIMVVIAMSPENIVHEQVRLKWERFNDLLTAGFKPDGVLISYIKGFDSINLPDTLRNNEVIIDGVDSFERLYRLIIDGIGIDVETSLDDGQFKKFFEKNTVFILSLVSGEGPDNIIITPGEMKTVGRLTDNDIILNRDVSRHHAKITYGENGIIVDDLGSTNGTRVNNKKIVSKKLELGDVVKFDAVSYRLSLAPEIP